MKIDDVLRHECFQLGPLHVISSYSSQGQLAFQPEQIEISQKRQADCISPRVATRNIDALVHPVSIGSSEVTAIDELGKPAEVWVGPDAGYELRAGQHALIYRGLDGMQFLMVVIQRAHVVPLFGSIAP
jgi:hypothetical protein